MLTSETVEALKKVQKELLGNSYSIKIYDCYRPQRAVDHFVRWGKDIKDTKMKEEFYPGIDKSNLFRDGFIAYNSGHSRGSTLDLTIVEVPIKPGEEYHDGDKLKDCTNEHRFGDNSIDMGTGFDCFSTKAWTNDTTINEKQKGNRKLLVDIMDKYGFQNYEKEWWHYTLRNEPYPNTYYDFPITSEICSENQTSI